jgi:hypothetical protein
MAASVSECIVALRRKDVYRALREKTLKNLRHLIQEVSGSPSFDLVLVVGLVLKATSVCFPGMYHNNRHNYTVYAP